MAFGCSRPNLVSLWFLLLFLSVAATCAAQSAAPNPSPRERAVFAESFANERLWRWQKRLQLEDWRISVLVARAADLKPKTLGNIRWDTDKKTATIRVLDPADYRMPLLEMLQDMEFTVVHELIHLELASVLSAFPRSDANRREEEHAVNNMADALLKLDRGR
jgi:hypothetical protein